MDKKSLLKILLDSTTSDAVIELGNNFQDDDTIDILINVSKNGNYDEMIAASCGESIAYIWLRNQRVDYKKLSKLKGIASIEALSLIKVQRPDWYKAYLDLYQI